jgi:hypothetical protein
MGWWGVSFPAPGGDKDAGFDACFDVVRESVADDRCRASRWQAGEDSNVASRPNLAGLRLDVSHNILGALDVYPIIQGYTRFTFAASARTMDSIPRADGVRASPNRRPEPFDKGNVTC